MNLPFSPFHVLGLGKILLLLGAAFRRFKLSFSGLRFAPYSNVLNARRIAIGPAWTSFSEFRRGLVLALPPLVETSFGVAVLACRR